MQTLIFCSTTNNTLSPMCQDNSLPLCDMPHKPYFQMVLEKLFESRIENVAVITPERSGNYLEFVENAKLPADVKLYSGGKHTMFGVARRLWEGGDMMLLDLSYFNLLEFDKMTTEFYSARQKPHCMVSASMVKGFKNLIPVKIKENNLVSDFLPGADNRNSSTDFAFTGVYILSQEFVSTLSPDTEEDTEKVLKKLAKDGGLAAFCHNSPFMRLCEPEDVKKCLDLILRGEMGVSLKEYEISTGYYSMDNKPLRGVTVVPPLFVGKNVTVGMGTVLSSGTILCRNVSVGEKCTLKNSLFMSGASCGNGVSADGSAIAEGAELMNGAECEKLSIVGASSVIGRETIVKGKARVWDGKVISPGLVVKGDVREMPDGEILFDDDGKFFDAGGFLNPVKATEIAMATAFCLDGKDSVCICAGENTSACNAVKSAVISGFSSSGIKAWDMGSCTEGQLYYAMDITDSAIGIIVSAEFSVSLGFVSKGGLRLTSSLERKIENAVNGRKFRCLSPFEYKQPSNGEAFNELYAKEIENILEDRLSGVCVSVRTPDKTASVLADRIFSPRNDINGEQVIFHPNHSQGTLSAYTENTGYVFWEKLCLIVAKEDLAKGLDVALPETFPMAGEELARKYGGRILRYDIKPCGRCDTEALRLAEDKQGLWVRDPLYLAVRITDILSRRGISLRSLAKEIPDFYCTRRFVAVDSTSEELKQAVGGDYYERAGARAFVRQVKNGGIMIYANAYDSETAAALCEDIESILKKQTGRKINNI